jgi:hypothetical protein
MLVPFCTCMCARIYFTPVYDSHVAFGQKFNGEKGSVRRVHCHDATASSSIAKPQGEVFAHFHALILKCHSSMQN